MIEATQNNNLDTVAKTALQFNSEKGLVYYKQQPFTGVSVVKTTNGLTVESAEYTKGKKHGSYKKWFDDGQLSFEATYIQGLRNGKAFTWWKNGNMRSQSNFKNGIADGKQYQWYKTGVKFKIITLVDGKEEGLQQAWRENGKIYNNYEAKNGRIFGLKRANLCFQLDEEAPQISSY